MREIKVALGKVTCRIETDGEIWKNTSFPAADRHSHIHYELHVILDGSCQMDIGNKTYSVSKGEALLVPPDEFHCTKTVSEKHGRFTMSFAVPTDAKINLALKNTTKTQLSEFDIGLCKRIISESEERYGFWSERCDALYSLLFLDYIHSVSGKEKNTSDSVFSNNDNRFSVIDDYFEKHLAGECSKTELADNVGLSVRQLGRVLDSKYGMSFRQKLLYARMDRAAWLLRTTDTPVSVICETVGYSSEPSFFKAFRERYGITPNQYRKHKE